jgi:hypothetical protein
MLTLNCMAMVAFGTTAVIEIESDAIGFLIGSTMGCLIGFTIHLLATWGLYIERKK